MDTAPLLQAASDYGDVPLGAEASVMHVFTDLASIPETHEGRAEIPFE